MRIPRKQISRIAAVLLVSAAAALPQQQAGKPEKPAEASALPAMPANQFVQRVVQNELNAHDGERVMYRDWRKTPEGSKTKEMIETNMGTVARLLAINDQPLTPQQRQADDARLQQLLSSPSLQKKKQKEQEEDDQRVKKMFRELPKAFLFEYVGVEPGSEGQELVHLKFQPNPRYDPPSREMTVFRGMNGNVWADEKSMRLAKIEAKLFREVTFGWGILGHLDPGGHFIVEQRKVGPDRWDATYMNIQFTGKALLFKTISLHQIEKLSDFRRVPGNLSLAQGVEMLKKSENQVAENKGDSEPK